MTKTDFHGDVPEEVWSINLSTTKLFIGLVAQVLVIVGVAWTTLTWAGNNIFEHQLDRFHKEAVPQISQMIDEKIERQKLEIERDRLALMRDLDRRLANIEGMLAEMNGK